MTNNEGWYDANHVAMEYALQQFDNRLETSREDFKDVDFKARYWLTGLLGLVTALTAWLIKGGEEQSLNWPLLILLSGYVIAAISFAVSLSPRPTGGKGITPDSFDIENWREELTSQNGKLALMARVIKAQKSQIITNENTAKKKAFWITWGIRVTVVTPILSLLVFLCSC